MKWVIVDEVDERLIEEGKFNVGSRNASVARHWNLADDLVICWWANHTESKLCKSS